MSENNTLKISETAQLAEQICTTVGTVIRGTEQTVRLLTAALFSGGHVLLEDLPGTGKTTLIKAFARVLNCDCKRVQCTPDLMPADITGFEILQQDTDSKRKMVFRKGPVFTNLLLADEINRMAPRSQSGLLECMAEKQVTSGGSIYALPEPFFVIATQNPIELQGTFSLPEAQLDRFLMRLSMGFPAREQELRVLEDRQTGDPLDTLEPVTDPQTLLAAMKAVREVKSSPDVLNYLLDLADATRKHAKLRCGLSTRGALQLRAAAQANAAMEGRDYLLPDDIKRMFAPVCTHRLSAVSGLLADRKSTEQIVAEVLESVPVNKS